MGDAGIAGVLSFIGVKVNTSQKQSVQIFIIILCSCVYGPVSLCKSYLHLYFVLIYLMAVDVFLFVPIICDCCSVRVVFCSIITIITP